ncbi:hypothetical protein Q8A73_010010 [Channa argus]|nr:hypothetical protein Q8A73_010010 [Channa argus]
MTGPLDLNLTERANVQSSCPLFSESFWVAEVSGAERVFRMAYMSSGYGVLAALFSGRLHMVLGVKHGAMLDQLSLCCLPQLCARPTGEGQMRTLSPYSTAHHNMGLTM